MMRCMTYHIGPFWRSPNERLHGWIHPVWLRCELCGSDISPDEVRRAVFRAAYEFDEMHLPPPRDSRHRGGR